MKTNDIEEIVLTHSNRGMDKLLPYMSENFILNTALDILKCEKGRCILTTGFYVAGYAETDGPSGIYVLGTALKKLGYDVVVVTDSFCKGFFDDYFTVEYVEKDFDAGAILEKYKPKFLLSSERCGKNVDGDYANMRGVSIAENTPEVDRLFDLAWERNIFTVGIGDGGNEIGMGNLHKEIECELSLVPCKTEVNDLVIATVSNWGCYGLAAALSRIAEKNLMMKFDEVFAYLEKTVEMGSVDGVNKTHQATVDGYDIEVSKEVYEKLYSLVKNY